jgi:predicted TIM-barrel fold metal-dependent hydrolase
MSQIMFEVDYPHGDSTWPNTVKVIEGLVRGAKLDEREIHQLLRGNAIECYGLHRFGIIA